MNGGTEKKRKITRFDFPALPPPPPLPHLFCQSINSKTMKGNAIGFRNLHKQSFISSAAGKLPECDKFNQLRCRLSYPFDGDQEKNTFSREPRRGFSAAKNAVGCSRAFPFSAEKKEGKTEIDR